MTIKTRVMIFCVSIIILMGFISAFNFEDFFLNFGEEQEPTTNILVNGTLDTNASTACAGAEILLGNGTCSSGAFLSGLGIEADPLWFSNWSSFNNSWGSTQNDSYYLQSNPYSFYNSTNPQTETDPVCSSYNYWNDTSSSFNKTYADALYAPIGSGNESWNQSFAETIFYSITNPYSFYNFTNPQPNIFSYYNSTNPQAETDPTWSLNFTAYNSSWSYYEIDTNETIRFNNLVGTNCSSGQAYTNISDAGALICSAITATEGDPLWSANFTAYNSSWSSTYNASYLTYESEPSWLDNYTKFNSTWSSMFNSSYLTYESDSLWLSNYTQFNSSWSYYEENETTRFNNLVGVNCTNGNAYTNITNSGTLVCSAITATETDPLWLSNYTTFNSSWGSTYNLTYDLWAYNQTTPAIAIILGFSYYNSTNPPTNIFGYYNSTNQAPEPLWNSNYTAFNSSWGSTQNDSYYPNSNPYSFYNSTNPSPDTNETSRFNSLVNVNCSSGQAYTNITNGGTLICSAISATESDPMWLSNYTAYNASWSSTQNDSYLTYESEPLWLSNYTAYNSSWSSVFNSSYLTSESDPLWLNNYTTFNASWGYYEADTNETTRFNNLISANCTSGEAYTNITEGGTLICSTITATEVDPLWSGNYSAFNDSWGSTYNASYLTFESEPLWLSNYTSFNVSWGYYESDTNETIRFDNLVGVNCSSGQAYTNITDAGTLICSAITTTETDPICSSYNYYNATNPMPNTFSYYNVTTPQPNTFSYYNQTNLDILGKNCSANEFYDSIFGNGTLICSAISYSETDPIATSYGYYNVTNPQPNTFSYYNSTSLPPDVYVNESGDTMTGNLTIGNNRICNATACTAYIYHNGTGWLIKG